MTTMPLNPFRAALFVCGLAFMVIVTHPSSAIAAQRSATQLFALKDVNSDVVTFGDYVCIAGTDTNLYE